MNSLMDVQWGIVRGVGNMAQKVENKLTENEERKDKQEQVLTTMYNDVRKITQELFLSR